MFGLTGSTGVFILLRISVSYSAPRDLHRRVTNEGSVPEIAQYGSYYLPLNDSTASKGSSFCILFVITAACVVPCGDPKKSPHTSSIVQIIIISCAPLRSVRIFRVLKIARLGPSSKHCFSYLIPFRHLSMIKNNLV